MVSFAYVKTGMSFDTCVVNSNVRHFGEVHKGVAKGRTLVNKHSVRKTSVDVSPTHQYGLPQPRGRGDLQEASCTEPGTFYNNVKHRFAVDIHDIKQYALVEANVLGTKGNVEASWGRLNPLTWITAAGDVLQCL